MSVKRYEPWPDNPPKGWPTQYVDAADYDALLLDNERLAGALEKIASCTSHFKGDVVDVARAALAAHRGRG